jgi:hypothetical protein
VIRMVRFASVSGIERGLGYDSGSVRSEDSE